MYTGFGNPVDPEVKFTIPGHVRIARGEDDPDGARGGGMTTVVRPSALPASAVWRSEGGRKTTVPGGIAGDVRHALGSGGKATTGSGRVESAKNTAMPCGSLLSASPASSAPRGMDACTTSSHPAAIAITSSD